VVADYVIMSPFPFTKTKYSDYRHAYVDCVASYVTLFWRSGFRFRLNACCLQLVCGDGFNGGSDS